MSKKRIVLVCLIFLLFNASAFAKAPLKWACADYAPAYYATETGEAAGFLYDIAIEALEKRMNIPVDISFLPWKRCQKLVKEGESDMIFTIFTPERAEYTLTHEKPAWVKQRVLYTYAGHPKIDEIHELRGVEDIKKSGLTIVSYLGNGWAKANIEPLDIPMQNAGRVELMYQMLARKRGDIIIEERSIASSSIEKLGLIDKIISTEGIASSADFRLLIGKKSLYADILPQLNTVIEEMWQDGTIMEILHKYGI